MSPSLAPLNVRLPPIYPYTYSIESDDTIYERRREPTQTNHLLSHPSSSTNPRGRFQQPNEDTLAQRGPVGVPLSRAGPGALASRSGSLPLLCMNEWPPAQAPPITMSPRSAYSVMDSDSDDPLPPRDHHVAQQSDADLVLNMHGGLDTSSRFKPKKVPYPRSYEQAILDLDTLDTRLIREMSGGSLTWHMFPPSWNVPMPGALKKVLDIGCGDGTWVIEAAKCWRGCEVVGLDVVSIHPNLEHISRGDREVAKRVTWVQANFLEGLPFGNDTFDFVHVKRIARGIPQDEWNQLFENIIRVMKPGAAFEVVEEDLSFPEHDGSRAGTLPSRGYTASATGTGSYDLGISSISNPGVESRGSNALGSTSINLGSANSTIIGAPKPDSRPPPRSYPQPSAPSSSRPPLSINGQPSSFRPSLNVKHPATFVSEPIDIPLTSSPTEMHRANSLRQSSPTSNLPEVPKRPSTATSTTPPTSASTHTPSSTPTSTSSIRPPPIQKDNAAAQAVLNERNTPFFSKPKIVAVNPPKVQKRTSANIDVLSEPNQPFFPQNWSGASLNGIYKDKGKEKGKEKSKGKGRSFFRRGGSKTPDLPMQAPPAEVSQVNWNEVAAVSDEGHPLIKVPQNPRNHAILEMIYNKMHEERRINLSPLDILANAVESRFINVRTHSPIIFRLPPSQDMSPYDVRSRKPNTPSRRTGPNDQNAATANPIISLDGVSPYASFDAETPTETRPHLLNPALNVVLRSLNLHLALRVKEIVACAEAMWEWVCEFQKREEIHDGEHARILELTRPQFDELVLRFELDMREQMGLESSSTEDRFDWSVIPGPTPQERRFFDTECEKWDAYQRLKSGGTYTVSHPTTRLSRSLGVFVAWKPIAPVN